MLNDRTLTPPSPLHGKEERKAKQIPSPLSFVGEGQDEGASADHQPLLAATGASMLNAARGHTICLIPSQLSLKQGRERKGNATRRKFRKRHEPRGPSVAA
jgi:hypothetical protein